MEKLLSEFKNIITFLSENTFLLIIIGFFILFAIREIRCWYWKIDERLQLQYQEHETLQEIVKLQKDQIRYLENAMDKMNQLICHTTEIAEAEKEKNT